MADEPEDPDKTPVETPLAIRQTPPPARKRSTGRFPVARVGTRQTVELLNPVPYLVIFPDGTSVEHEPGQPLVVRTLRPVLVRR